MEGKDGFLVEVGENRYASFVLIPVSALLSVRVKGPRFGISVLRVAVVMEGADGLVHRWGDLLLQHLPHERRSAMLVGGSAPSTVLAITTPQVNVKDGSEDAGMLSLRSPAAAFFLFFHLL